MKIFNKNYNDPKITRKINGLVGKPFSFRERLKRKGIGSSKLRVMEFSESLKHHFGENQDLKYISIEMRPKGIIIYIKSKINDYAWAIPYYLLTIFQSNYYSIHTEGVFVKLDLTSVYPLNENFVKKMQGDKAHISGENVLG